VNDKFNQLINILTLPCVCVQTPRQMNNFYGQNFALLHLTICMLSRHDNMYTLNLSNLILIIKQFLWSKFCFVASNYLYVVTSRQHVHIKSVKFNFNHKMVHFRSNEGDSIPKLFINR
jgi:hypothetical protein